MCVQVTVLPKHPHYLQGIAYVHTPALHYRDMPQLPQMAFIVGRGMKQLLGLSLRVPLTNEDDQYSAVRVGYRGIIRILALIRVGG